MERSPTRVSIVAGRSCNACRRRKIRCNRQQPCSYCHKLNQQCTYQETSQVVSMPSANPHDINSRLDRIEKALARIELKSSESISIAHDDIQDSQVDRSQSASSIIQDSSSMSKRTSVVPPAEGKQAHSELDDTVNTVWTEYQEDEMTSPSPERNDIGTLETPESTKSTHRSNYQGFIFGAHSKYINLQHLHPDEKVVFTLWQMFLENVDPIIKIFHIPSIQAQIMRGVRDISEISPEFECTLFAIYFATITSCQCLTTCQELLGADRQTLLPSYQFAVEQALAKANFMSTPSFLVLQALTLFLICARQSVDKTYVWSLTGLLIRLATKIGLHRDPTPDRFSPFEREMRRRLWWQICTLDVRVAEENDMDPSIHEHHFNTKLPANVSDSDLDPKMKHSVGVRNPCSDMLYSLCRFKISHAARMLVFSPKFTSDNHYPLRSIEEKNAYIESLFQTLENDYFSKCDIEIPINYLTITSVKMVITKIRLTIYHSARDDLSCMSQQLLSQLVKSSVEILDYARDLRSKEEYARWSWLFQSYIEWDAVAFLLHCLCASSLHIPSEDVWNAIDLFFAQWSHHALAGHQRWQRLQNLRSKAIASRGSREAGSLIHENVSQNSISRSFELPNNSNGQSGPAASLPQIPENSLVCTDFSNQPTDNMLDEQLFYGQSDWSITDMNYTQGSTDWSTVRDTNMFSSWL